MPIIKCPECGHEISDRARSCPHCGVDIAGGRRSYSAIAVACVVALIGILLGLYFADNAQQQLAQQPDSQPENIPSDGVMQTEEMVPDVALAADTSSWDPLPLDPVVVDAPGVPAVEEVSVSEETKTENPMVHDTPEGEDFDDFKEIDPEEEERLQRNIQSNHADSVS